MAYPARLEMRPDEMGAKEGSVSAGQITLNTEVFKACLGQDRPTILRPGCQYQIGSQLGAGGTGIVSHSGLVCYGSQPAELFVKTETGFFDAATYTALAGRSVIRVQDIDDFTLAGIHFQMESVTAGTIRTTNPLFLTNITGWLDISFANFRETDTGYVLVNSCDGYDSSGNSTRGTFTIARCYGYDCNPDSTSLTQGQCTVLQIDANRTIHTGGEANGYSQNLIIDDVGAFNIKPGNNWKSAYGNVRQSDGVGIVGTSATTDAYFRIGRIITDGVGEPLDISNRSGIQIREIIAKNTYDTGVIKLWGCSRIHIGRLVSDANRINVAFIKATAVNAAKDIIINDLFAVNCSSLDATEGSGAGGQTAVLFQNDTLTVSAGTKYLTNCRINNLFVRGTAYMDYGITAVNVGSAVSARGPILDAQISPIYPTNNRCDWNDGQNRMFRDGTDPSKCVVFDVSNVSTSATRSIALPNVSGTLALTSQVAAYTDTTNWTPAWTMTGTSSTFTYSTQTGKYWQIGNLYFFTGSLVLSSKGTAGTGNARIGGLPFTQNAAINMAVYVNWTTNVNLSTGYTSCGGALVASGSEIRMREFGDNVTFNDFTLSSLNDTTNINFFGMGYA